MKPSLRRCHGPWGGPGSCHDVPAAFEWLRWQAPPQCPPMAPGSHGGCWAGLQGAWESMWDESGSQVPCSVERNRASRFYCRPVPRAQDLIVSASRRSGIGALADACASLGTRHSRPLARSGFVAQEVSMDTGRVFRYGSPVSGAVCLFGSGKGKGGRDRAAVSALSHGLSSTGRQRRSPARRRVAVRADC